MATENKQRLLGVIIGVVISICLLGAAAYGYMRGAGGAPTTGPGGQEPKNQAANLAQLEGSLQGNPSDLNLRLEVANGYYDLGIAVRDSAPEDSNNYLRKAVGHYQEVLKGKKDVNILVDLATAAFYSGDDIVADENYHKAIELNPKFYPAHFNYGVFLFHAKQDYAGCLKEWKTALELQPTGPEAERLQKLITGLEQQSSQQITSQMNPLGQ